VRMDARTNGSMAIAILCGVIDRVVTLDADPAVPRSSENRRNLLADRAAISPLRSPYAHGSRLPFHPRLYANASAVSPIRRLDRTLKNPEGGGYVGQR